MSSQDDQHNTGHTYDGIVELDNPMPGWWILIFFGTIIFAGIYYLHYESGAGPTLDQELAAAMKKWEGLKKAGPSFSEDKLSALFTEEAIGRGKPTYDAKCANCHGQQGEGLIGPNLTDNHWIYGKGSRVDVVKVIAEGVLNKGMPAWGTMISENELIEVSAYVHAMKGKMISGKPPQGEEAN